MQHKIFFFINWRDFHFKILGKITVRLGRRSLRAGYICPNSSANTPPVELAKTLRIQQKILAKRKSNTTTDKIPNRPTHSAELANTLHDHKSCLQLQNSPWPECVKWKSCVRFGRVKIVCEIDKLDAEQCSRGWRYESCHHFRLENSIYFSGREIVGNTQRNVLMLSFTFQRQQHTAPATTPCPL